MTGVQTCALPICGVQSIRSSPRNSRRRDPTVYVLCPISHHECKPADGERRVAVSGPVWRRIAVLRGDREFDPAALRVTGSDSTVGPAVLPAIWSGLPCRGRDGPGLERCVGLGGDPAQRRFRARLPHRALLDVPAALIAVDFYSVVRTTTIPPLGIVKCHEHLKLLQPAAPRKRCCRAPVSAESKTSQRRRPAVRGSVSLSYPILCFYSFE